MKKLITLSLIIFLSVLATKAGHIAGAQIAYKYLGNAKYEITVTAYRDCNSQGLSNTPINYSCVSGTGSGTKTLTQISMIDVTGITPGCNVQSRCSGSYSIGYHEYVFVGTIDLSSFTCCEVIVSWAQCCGAAFSNVNTSGTNFYTEARLNKCVPSSIQWTKIAPQFILTQGQDQILNFSASDVTDYDSISYELVDALSAAGTTIGYAGQYTAQRPITFLGFPNTGLGNPAGLQFDAKRGNLYCRPTKKDETPIICVKATEWRKISGTMTKIGSIRRDISFVVISASNTNKNTIQSSMATSAFAACPSDTSVAVIKFTDGDANDTFDFQFTHNLKWARASFVGDNTSRSIKVEYLVDSIPGGEIANAFTLVTMDDNCPIRGRSIKTYGLTASGQKFIDSSFITHTSKCGNVKFKANNRLIGANYFYSWDITGAGILKTFLADSVSVLATKAGWVKARLTVYSSQHCNVFEYIDSVLIQSNDFVSVDVGPDVEVCSSAVVLNTAFPTSAVPPISYLWSNGDTIPQLNITPSLNISSYSVTITDARGCKAADSLVIKNHHPSIVITGPDKVCSDKSFILNASITSGFITKHGWFNNLNNQLQIADSIKNTKQYVFAVEDGGCTFTATKTVFVSKPQLQYNNPTMVCKGDTMRLKVIPSGGVIPYSVYWDTYFLSGENISVTTAQAATGITYFTTTITDSLGCASTIYGSVFINPLPVVTATAINPVCESAGKIDLALYVSPSGGTWAGNGVFNNDFYPQQAGGVGSFVLTYNYSSPNTGCNNKTQTSVSIQSQPIAGFTADSTRARYTHSFSFYDSSKNSQGLKRVWNFGDPNSGTANTSTLINTNHQFSDTGTYTVKLWVDGGVCPADSIIKTGYITVYGKSSSNISVNEISGAHISIYPTPAENIIEIRVEGNEYIHSISISDITGKEINSQVALAENSATITKTTEKPGVYFVRVLTANGHTYTGKIIWQ